MNSDTSLVCFKAISNFTTELGQLFGHKQRSLKLYCRLINKTTIVHNKSITKHIDAFKSFCITNREAITTKNANCLTMSKISYSQRVFIDIVDIFRISDKSTSEVIWQHLLCISAMVDPSGKAREILKENLSSGFTSGEETNFLTDIIDKVEANVDENATPMEAVSAIMKSGIFNDLIGGMNDGMNNGSLDIAKLMGVVQGMVGKLGDQTNGDPQAEGAMNMLSSMMGNLGGNTDGDKNNPIHGGQDVDGTMNMISSMMSNLGANVNDTKSDTTEDNPLSSKSEEVMKGVIEGMLKGDNTQ